ncbi:hypothetical protein DH2020_022175 [Rehmannia glutinosa]|uniref:Cytokinin riboside 5'-monophosphate phosphoribohydrolase n=1 Tax=Rehmannia glutinosa TaxID=99300 RepID=A0ABR0WDZ1_REHGL
MEVSSFRRFNTIDVLCGSSPRKNSCFLEEANNLGKVFAKKQIHLVHGGGCLRLMGRIAGSAYLEGVKVLGVIPKSLSRHITSETIGDELRVLNMQDRMVNMMNNVDAVITLPGGFGTLEELFQMVFWAQLNTHQKPIGILSVNGFFDGLLLFLDYAVKKGFISPPGRRIIICATTPNELTDKLQAYIHEPNPIVAHIVWPQDTCRKRKLDLSLTL